MLRLPPLADLGEGVGRLLEQLRTGGRAVHAHRPVLEGQKSGFREGDVPTQFVGKSPPIPLEQFQSVFAHAERDDFTARCFLKHLI